MSIFPLRRVLLKYRSATPNCTPLSSQPGGRDGFECVHFKEKLEEAEHIITDEETWNIMNVLQDEKESLWGKIAQEKVYVLHEIYEMSPVTEYDIQEFAIKLRYPKIGDLRDLIYKLSNFTQKFALWLLCNNEQVWIKGLTAIERWRFTTDELKLYFRGAPESINITNTDAIELWKNLLRERQHGNLGKIESTYDPKMANLSIPNLCVECLNNRPGKEWNLYTGECVKKATNPSDQVVGRKEDCPSVTPTCIGCMSLRQPVGAMNPQNQVVWCENSKSCRPQVGLGVAADMPPWPQRIYRITIDNPRELVRATRRGLRRKNIKFNWTQKLFASDGERVPNIDDFIKNEKMKPLSSPTPGKTCYKVSNETKVINFKEEFIVPDDRSTPTHRPTLTPTSVSTTPRRTSTTPRQTFTRTTLERTTLPPTPASPRASRTNSGISQTIEYAHPSVTFRVGSDLSTRVPSRDLLFYDNQYYENFIEGSFTVNNVLVYPDGNGFTFNVNLLRNIARNDEIAFCEPKVENKDACEIPSNVLFPENTFEHESEYVKSMRCFLKPRYDEHHTFWLINNVELIDTYKEMPYVIPKGGREQYMDMMGDIVNLKKTQLYTFMTFRLFRTLGLTTLLTTARSRSHLLTEIFRKPRFNLTPHANIALLVIEQYDEVAGRFCQQQLTEQIGGGVPRFDVKTFLDLINEHNAQIPGEEKKIPIGAVVKILLAAKSFVETGKIFHMQNAIKWHAGKQPNPDQSDGEKTKLYTFLQNTIKQDDSLLRILAQILNVGGGEGTTLYNKIGQLLKTPNAAIVRMILDTYNLIELLYVCKVEYEDTHAVMDGSATPLHIKIEDETVGSIISIITSRDRSFGLTWRNIGDQPTPNYYSTKGTVRILRPPHHPVLVPSTRFKHDKIHKVQPPIGFEKNMVISIDENISAVFKNETSAKNEATEANEAQLKLEFLKCFHKATQENEKRLRELTFDDPPKMSPTATPLVQVEMERSAQLSQSMEQFLDILKETDAYNIDFSEKLERIRQGIEHSRSVLEVASQYTDLTEWNFDNPNLINSTYKLPQEEWKKLIAQIPAVQERARARAGKPIDVVDINLKVFGVGVEKRKGPVSQNLFPSTFLEFSLKKAQEERKRKEVHAQSLGSGPLSNVAAPEITEADLARIHRTHEKFIQATDNKAANAAAMRIEMMQRLKTPAKTIDSEASASTNLERTEDSDKTASPKEVSSEWSKELREMTGKLMTDLKVAKAALELPTSHTSSDYSDTDSEASVKEAGGST